MRRLLPVAMLTTLSACSLQPLYSGSTAGPVATLMAGIDVAPIEGKGGWLVANALRDRLHAVGEGPARYRLTVRLDDRIVGLGVRADDAVSRERRPLRARYQLLDTTQGTVLLDATAASDAGIDVVGSEYATIAAESSALERLSEMVADQIVARVALYARRSQSAR